MISGENRGAKILRAPELPERQKAIRVGCFHPSGTFIEFPREEIEQSIPRRFEKIARLYPDRVAVKTNKRALTYDDLNNAANLVAAAVLERADEGDEPVALLLENDAPMIAARLGVLKSGKPYVPLDTFYPRASLEYILRDCGARLVVTDSRKFSLGGEWATFGVRWIDAAELDSNRGAPNPEMDIAPDRIANILYTSGSTGEPKGVMQNHRNVLHEIMNYTNGAHISAEDRLALVSSPSFSGTIRTFYGALLNGAVLCPLDIREDGLERLAGWMIEQGITLYRSVPAIFRQFAGALTGRESFPDLRLIYLAGDSISRADVELYKNFFPRAARW